MCLTEQPYWFKILGLPLPRPLSFMTTFLNRCPEISKTTDPRHIHLVLDIVSRIVFSKSVYGWKVFGIIKPV